MKNPTYTEIIEWIYNRLPIYQSQGKSALNAKLDNIYNFCKRLDNPHHKFKSIHVAGTNGKGSCAHMLSSILQEAGYKVGLYTSPHLIDFRERIKINGRQIPKRAVIEFVGIQQDNIESLALSFFELTVAMAFEYFATQQVDIAVIETGLGGRWDSTNIIDPEICLITNIGMDHTDILGDSIQKIAREKAGIIKVETPVVLSEYQAETSDVFEEVAKKHMAPLTVASQNSDLSYTCDLKGSYQDKNMKGVCATIAQLKGFEISDQAISEGLSRVVVNTGLKGRWQQLRDCPKVITDTAHNAEGFEEIVKQIGREHANRLHLVIGFVTGKAISDILEIMPKEACYYLCEPKIGRALTVKDLARLAKQFHLDFEVFPDVYSAYKAALYSADMEDMVYVGGSTFVVGELLKCIEDDSQ